MEQNNGSWLWRIRWKSYLCRSKLRCKNNEDHLTWKLRPVEFRQSRRHLFDKTGQNNQVFGLLTTNMCSGKFLWWQHRVWNGHWLWKNWIREEQWSFVKNWVRFHESFRMFWQVSYSEKTHYRASNMRQEARLWFMVNPIKYNKEKNHQMK